MDVRIRCSARTHARACTRTLRLHNKILFSTIVRVRVRGVFAAADLAIARSSWSTWHRHHFRTPRRGSRRHLQDPPRRCLPDHAPAVPANVVVVVVVDLVRSCSSLRELHWYCTVSLLLFVFDPTNGMEWNECLQLAELPPLDS